MPMAAVATFSIDSQKTPVTQTHNRNRINSHKDDTTPTCPAYMLPSLYTI